MRTTLTLDSDVAHEVEALSRDGRPMKQIINEALRLGLPQLKKPTAPHPYRTKSHKMGLRAGHNLDNIAELLTQLEGESRR
ncbi:MAG TPA: hypothetical protein VGG44_04365 [Tepidisphaeraceae bacterium]|jgi:hypothetical protein